MSIKSIQAKISSFLNKGTQRSAKAKKNILVSFLMKFVSIIISLQLVPLTIDYVSTETYGIWLTLSSVIVWMGYFDMGFANGFRNKFAEAKSNGDTFLARQLVSTTYAVLSILFTIILVASLLINSFIDWSNLFGISSSFNEEISLAFSFLALFFCIHFVANIINMFLTACQLPAVSSLLSTLGQLLGFITILILTRISTGSLVLLAIGISGVPCAFLLIASLFIFRRKQFQEYSPSLKHINFKLTKQIIGLGFRFFLITMSMLLIFQLVNIILAKTQGPTAVAEYNISYKYFNVLYMVIGIIMSPIWSAFTDAYTKHDIVWMDSIMKKLEKLLLVCIILFLVMLIISPSFYRIWVGENRISIPFTVSLSTVIYIFSMTAGMVYMHMINGIGKIQLQLLIYVCFALVSFPFLYMSSKLLGIPGVLILPSIVYLVQAFIIRIQLKKILNGSAKGIWNK